MIDRKMVIESEVVQNLQLGGVTAGQISISLDCMRFGKKMKDRQQKALKSKEAIYRCRCSHLRRFMPEIEVV